MLYIRAKKSKYVNLFIDASKQIEKTISTVNCGCLSNLVKNNGEISNNSSFIHIYIYVHIYSSYIDLETH